MADYYSAQISIGGPIKEQDCRDLFKHVANEGLGFDWDEALDIDKDDDYHRLLDEIKRCEADKMILELKGNEVKWGSLSDTEKLCQEHGWTFHSYSEATYDSNHSIIFWKPGMEEPSTVLCTLEQEAAVRINQITRIILDSSHPVAQVRSLRQLLEPLIPCDIPPITYTSIPEKHKVRSAGQRIKHIRNKT